MKNLLLLLAVSLLRFTADAQICTGSLTYSAVPNTYTINFTNTSTATGGSAGASTYRSISLYNGATPTSANYIASYSANNPAHSFPGPGQYTAVATVVRYDSSVVPAVQLCQDTTWYPITLAPQPCAVSVSSVTGTANTKTFTANNNIPTAGVTYTWNFGDGSPAATGIQVTHTYASTGSFTVTVTASSSACTATANTVVFISSIALNCATATAGFTVNATTTNAVFTNTSTPNAASVSGMVRYNYWSFGQSGSATTTGQTGVTFPYGIPGTYNVRLITNWVNAGTTSPVVCADTFYQTVVVANGIFNCATANASFTASVYNNNSVSVSATSTTIGGYTNVREWDFGDGTPPSVGQSVVFGHSYANTGTYSIRLIDRWYVFGTTNLVCEDTAYQTVTVTAPNYITGYVSVDSNQVQSSDSFKVWLISYNSSTMMLQAVDSLVTPGWGAGGFTFHNKPAGIYRTKAHKLYQSPGALGFVPTYRDSSLTWGGAQTFNHTGGITHSGAIYLKQGLVTSGPGFIGGSVLSGANKGTADGDPVVNQLVFLRDAATGNLVQGVYTNSAGQYSFANVPLGTYRVYPEEMNYMTTASAPVTLTAGSASASGILFKKDDVDMDIKQVTAGVGDVAELASGFTLSPNPTTGKVLLNIGASKAGGKTTIQVTSVTGRLMYTHTTATGATTLDLSHLTTGVYSVSMSSDMGISFKKLVITR